jgi:RHH-type transcriptional regulator, rel operon repressor / antitoxin RelB
MQQTPRDISMLALRLSPEIEKRLDRLAKLTGRTKSYYARKAITAYLDNLEDIYLSEQRLADVHAGRSDTIPLSGVMAQYGLDD